MRILFYIIHPSKYHVFRHVINEFKKNNTVDLIINSKDVLEELIINEGWNYVNIFPKGRNISKKPSLIISGLKILITIIRLEKYLITKRAYDIFITDDALVFNGWMRNIPSVFFNDNDVETIKVNKVLFYFATKLISPATVKLGIFEKKKIAFKGNKALSNFHPKYFSKNENVLSKYNLIPYQYSIIRLSKINATHDIGNKGITDEDLIKCFALCLKYSTVIISSERLIDKNYKDFIYKGKPYEFAHLLAYSKILITDSTTMAAEAAVLGTPNILINELGIRCSVNRELSEYGLQFIYNNYSDSELKIKEILSENLSRDDFENKSRQYVEKCDDLNQFILNNLIRLISTKY